VAIYRVGIVSKTLLQWLLVLWSRRLAKPLSDVITIAYLLHDPDTAQKSSEWQTKHRYRFHRYITYCEPPGCSVP
jgi:hypothetical protein